MTVRLVIAQHSLKTGRILGDILGENGVRLTTSEGARAIVSYGVRLPHSGVPTLNAKAGMADKHGQLLDLQRSGVAVPKVVEPSKAATRDGLFFPPLLARKKQHRAGKDLMPVFQPEEVPWRRAAGAEFFVEYTPIADEFRVWVFRKNHLGTYIKVMARPAEYKKIGRNYHNGFAFSLMKSESVPRGAVEVAIQSVAVLGLDFAAVDILRATDGRFLVLELNTAPGVEGPARQVIRALGSHIAKWEQAGYPARKA